MHRVGTETRRHLFRIGVFARSKIISDDLFHLLRERMFCHRCLLIQNTELLRNKNWWTRCVQWLTCSALTYHHLTKDMRYRRCVQDSRPNSWAPRGYPF